MWNFKDERQLLDRFSPFSIPPGKKGNKKKDDIIVQNWFIDQIQIWNIFRGDLINVFPILHRKIKLQ